MSKSRPRYFVRPVGRRAFRLRDTLLPLCVADVRAAPQPDLQEQRLRERDGDRIGLLGGRAGVVEEGPDRLCHRVDERDEPAERDVCSRLSEPVGDGFLRAVVAQTDLVLVVEPVLAVFALERVGVRSRRELVARIFAEQYWPRIARGTPLASDGRFRDGG
jgi:hypothetical protein